MASRNKEIADLRTNGHQKTTELEALRVKVEGIEATNYSVSEREAEIARLNEFIDKRLSSLVGWAENQGFKVEDFSRISDETPKRWKKAPKGSP